MQTDPTFYEANKEIILVAVTALATLVATKLLPWLGAQVGRGVAAWKRRLDEGSERTSFEDRYRRYVAEKHRFLQVTGIKTRTQVSIELDRVYVNLELKRKAAAPRRTEAPTAEDALVLERFWERPTRLEDRNIRPGEDWEAAIDLSFHGTEPTEQTYEVGEALRALDDRIVILGAPGSGKTTLVRYLAVTFADRKGATLGIEEDFLPILIPLRDWVKDQRPLTPETLSEYVLGDTLSADCPAGFFRRMLDDGRCLVLLDGMDEVSSEGDRTRAAREIDALVAAYGRLGNRFVVTSRPAGYEGVSLAGFTVLRVRDFSDDDVEAFARRWSEAVEVAARGVKREEDMAWDVAMAEAERQAESLIRAIREKDRVRQLAVNPLLLTIVALVHRYRAVLPDRRVELYDECVQVLLNYWDAAKGIAGQMEWRQKRRVLEDLALAMHRQETTWLRRAEVEAELQKALPLVGEKPEEAEAFLDEVRTRSGLLVERGVNEFGFSHLTFQEYLAALALRRQGDAGREELVGHLDDPWWKEVLLLYAGLDDVTDLARDLLAMEPGLFLTPLFTAADMLAEAVTVEPEVTEQVSDALIREWMDGTYWTRKGLARTTLVRLARSRPEALERLRSLSRDDSKGVRQSAAYALGFLGEAGILATGDLVGTLMGLLGDESEDVRASAAFALGRLGEAAAPAAGDIAGALVGLLGDESERVRQSAAYALGRLREAAGDASLVVALFDPREQVALSAAAALAPTYIIDRQTLSPPTDAKPELERLLDDQRKVSNLMGPDVLMRDVAWDLLYALHQQDRSAKRPSDR